MSAPGEKLKERLRALRIDREAQSGSVDPRRPRNRAPVVAVALGIVVAAGLIYRFVLIAPLTVRVVAARVPPSDRLIEGPVLSGSGYVITAEKYIAIGVRVPGRIERFLVDEGDQVVAGQVLVELDARDYRAQVGRAAASLRLANANLKLATADRGRMRQLFERGFTSRQELDQAESRQEVAAASVAQAENELSQARTNLDDTRLLSPVKGVVLAKLKGVGEIAVPGGFAGSGDLLRLADLSEIRAEVDVSEADMANVRLGQDAEVVPDAYSHSRYRAKVVKLYPQVNRQKGTLKVEVRVEKPDQLLVPDMSVRVTFFAEPLTSTGGAAEPVVLVPRTALHDAGGRSYVWMVIGGRLTRRPVEVGREIGAEVAVASGLVGGESLAVGSDAEFREGRAVRPQP
jgi:RND family efflux transporter MFP subunit